MNKRKKENPCLPWDTGEKFIFRILAGIVFIIIGMTGNLQAQDNERLLYRADNYFKIENYEEARPLYKQAVENGVSDPLAHYRLGVCYTKAPALNEQLKALPYLETAKENRSGTDIPDEVYYYLGNVFHKDNKMEKAIENYKTYMENVNEDNWVRDVARKLEQAQNGLDFINNKKNIVINRFDSPINSDQTEYNPLITADESYMAYTGLREEDGEWEEKIFITYKEDNKNWGQPQPVNVKSQYNVGTAGITPDGQQMLIYIGGAGNEGNIYKIEKSGDNWSEPVDIGNNINSQYLETTASITPDGKTIYFASDRRGGEGGLDIYKAERREDGTWGKPENLGPAINTPYDEDAPFIHPDSKTLFFTSDGHNSMGGSDIFKSYLISDSWKEPENLGYPVNTSSDDNYFTMTANAERGFFSSERKGGKGGQDIYYFNMPEESANIPLTMLKGKILAGEDPKPVPTEIKVVDKDNGEEIEYVYNPSKASGSYLIILPPGKNYDLVIESEGYLPYTVNVNIPNQNEFYQLYQKIVLHPVKQFGEVVGQNVSVNNQFYDTGQESKVEARKAREAMLVQNDSVDLYDMMETAIASEDTAAYKYLMDLMYNTDPVDSVDFEKNRGKNEVADVTYYYDETGRNDLVPKVVGKDTVYTLPTFHVTQEALKQEEVPEEEPISYNESILKENRKVYFPANESSLSEEHQEKLAAILKELQKHKRLGIEIAGYASPEGDEEYNRELSKKRAVSVLNYFNRKGIVRRRIVAKGFGAIEDSDVDKEESRRVEVQMIDVEKYREE